MLLRFDKPLHGRIPDDGIAVHLSQTGVGGRPGFSARRHSCEMRRRKTDEGGIRVRWRREGKGISTRGFGRENFQVIPAPRALYPGLSSETARPLEGGGRRPR